MANEGGKDLSTLPEVEGVELNKQVVVFPGDKLTITDVKGAQFLIDGQDDPLLIELAWAVDAYFMARNLDRNSAEMALGVLHSRFNDLPERVRRQLPHFVSGAQNV